MQEQLDVHYGDLLGADRIAVYAQECFTLSLADTEAIQLTLGHTDTARPYTGELKLPLFN